MRGTWKLQPWKKLGLVPPELLLKPVSDEPIYFELHTKKINLVFKLTVTIALSIFAILWAVFSFWLDICAISIHGLVDWFAPSGAVLAISGVCLEWRIRTVFDYQQTHAEGPLICKVMGNHRAAHSKKYPLEVIAISLILVGTAIWAYGDKTISLAT